MFVNVVRYFVFALTVVLLALPVSAAPACADCPDGFPADEAEFRLEHPIQERPFGLHPPTLCGALDAQAEYQEAGLPTPEYYFRNQEDVEPSEVPSLLPTVTPTPTGSSL